MFKYVAGILTLAFYGLFMFGVGYSVCYNNMPQYQCPQVPGGKVVTTIDEGKKQTCVYVEDKRPGRAQLKVTL